MRSSYSTVETKRHICDIQEHKCPLTFHLSTGMSLSSAGTFNKSLGNGSTFSSWSLLFGMNLTKTHRSITSHVTPFFPTRSSHSHWDFSNHLLRSVRFKNLSSNQRMLKNYVSEISILFFYSRKPRDKSKVQAGLTCSASHASLKCHASFKTLALSLVKVGLKPR